MQPSPEPIRMGWGGGGGGGGWKILPDNGGARERGLRGELARLGGLDCFDKVVFEWTFFRFQ